MKFLAALGAALALAGCGLGPGPGTSDVSLSVTRSFGETRVGSATERQVPGSETVMRMLERSFRVQTRYGGGYVQSINGLSGDSSRHDWFYYVNGIEAPVGAASTAVHHGDRIWWDLHDWTRHGHGPGRRGLVPRAVRSRCRRQAAAHDARVRARHEQRVRAGVRGAQGGRRSRSPASCSGPARERTRWG